MKMDIKKITLLVICLMSFFVNSTFAQTSRKVLNVRYQSQSTEVWCWAASIAMCYNWVTGKNVDDCHVVSYRFDDLINCCLFPNECRTAAMPEVIEQIVRSVGDDFYGIKYERSFDFEEIQSEIDLENPIMVIFGNPLYTKGHVVVISGYRTRIVNGEEVQEVRVLDPWPFKGRSWKEINDFTDNYYPEGTWVETVTVF